MAAVGEEYSATNAFILFKDRSSSTDRALTYPSEKLVRTVGIVVSLIESILDTEAHKEGIEARIILSVMNSVDFAWLTDGCLVHHQDLKNGIVKSTVRITIPWWCKKQNRKMAHMGRQRAVKRKLRVLQHL
ncbi:hypothetical protein L9F63_025944 [Diploptera punctata]|uniref:Uncharacterized protein n=1 Tax=Diploptera punctata TaxID=6984 RepID=A0AAD7Z5Q8_DIPPU|nr:hypothetical protein L9F63_025944 [Diploptera punctata]